MDPSRSGSVLARHAGIDQETGQLTAGQDGGPRRLVISSDFYAVYQSAGKKADGLVNLYCWAHYPGAGIMPGMPAKAQAAAGDPDAACGIIRARRGRREDHRAAGSVRVSRPEVPCGRVPAA
jgi:hypothetical protein